MSHPPVAATSIPHYSQGRCSILFTYWHIGSRKNNVVAVLFLCTAFTVTKQVFLSTSRFIFHQFIFRYINLPQSKLKLFAGKEGGARRESPAKNQSK